MRFFARVGVLPDEQLAPQPIEIDISVWTNEARGGAESEAGLRIDYRTLRDVARDAVRSGHFDLLEQLATRISDRVLEIPDAHGSRVSIRKVHPRLGIPLAHAQVSLERSREG
jgi:dihydroneopterin aldolase